MCGICGQFNFRDRAPVDPAAIRRMANAIVHRGPDDDGYFVSDGLGLGFRRLSIIDLSGGHQPMTDAEESIRVVFNGEIYNFPELRRELEDQGHVFRTQSDTEVIIHGYKQWGTEVLNRLNGMFGLAIWDERHQRLVLARDAAGIKLVYYRVDGGSLLFASEIRSILAALERPPEVDVTALNLFLRYRYTPSPLTIYAGIRKLAPGTMAVFEGGNWREERWYRFRPNRLAVPRSDGEAGEELLAIYKRALKRHLLSDVPVGLLLSGGVDSGLLLGLMNLGGSAWPTFTVGYSKAEYRNDELSEAEETARIFDARHVRVELSRETFERTLPRIVASVEEPIATSSIVPMYFVCQRAREDVKVALMGQGPDELFGGYTRHLGIRYGAAWRRLPGWARHGIEGGVRRLPRNAALKRGIYALGVDSRMQRYQNALSIMPGAMVDGLFQEDLLPRGAGDTVREIWGDLEPEMEGSDELGGFQVLELRSSLPDELLMYADKLSMAHSLEVRVPFLDKEVVEYVEALPESFKVRHGRRKWLHRRVCEGFLPRSIIARKKRGFAVDVVDSWFKGAFGSNIDSYLLDGASQLSTFLKPKAVQRLLVEHRSGKADNHKMLFSLVVFEEWLRYNQTQVGNVRA
ncbi:MAG: asparagine synthase (glutamine-hydrolyzing) [Rhodospirillales bacterium]